MVFSQNNGTSIIGAPDYSKTVSFTYTRKGSGSSEDDYYWVTPSDYGWMIYTAYQYKTHRSSNDGYTVQPYPVWRIKGTNFPTISTYRDGYPIEHYATEVGSVYAPIFVEPGYSYGVMQERKQGGISQNGIIVYAIKK